MDTAQAGPFPAAMAIHAYGYCLSIAGEPQKFALTEGG
jgi:hypothetical protein